jgi:hypothetical protein
MLGCVRKRPKYLNAPFSIFCMSNSTRLVVITFWHDGLVSGLKRIFTSFFSVVKFNLDNRRRVFAGSSSRNEYSAMQNAIELHSAPP